MLRCLYRYIILYWVKARGRHPERVRMETKNNRTRIGYLSLSKSNKPIVGFCGLNSKYRQNLINLLNNNDNIQTNFIVRNKFWGGNPHDEQLVEDFRQNIEQSHFTICNRGTGNFSMRFYQVLSCGRIGVGGEHASQRF